MDISKILANIQADTIDINKHLGTEELEEYKPQYEINSRDGEVFYVTSICGLTLVFTTREGEVNVDFNRQLIDGVEHQVMTELPRMYDACVAKFNEKEWGLPPDGIVPKAVRDCDVKLTHIFQAMRQYVATKSIDGIGALPNAVDFVMFAGVVAQLEETKFSITSNLKVEIHYLEDGNEKSVDLF